MSSTDYTMQKNIFVFTGGGLAPALNPTLYGVITEARKQGWNVYGGLYGWASLLPNGRHVDLTKVSIEALKDTGGTLLRSSRANPFAVPNGSQCVKERLRELRIDAVVAIGGDDTLGAAAKLASQGIPIVGIPKTIDNDLPGTYFTPGFPSAAYSLAAFTNEIKQDAAYALSRIFIIEAMGFKAGWLTAAGALGGADVVLPPEWIHSWRAVADLTSKRYEENGNFAVILVSQEAQFDQEMKGLPDHQIGEGHGNVRQSFLCLSLRDRIRAELGIDAKALYPGNFLETGKPIAVDRDIAIALGKKAIELLKRHEIGSMACVRRPNALSLELEVGAFPLDSLAQEKHRPLPKEMFDPALLTPTPAFYDYMAPLVKKFPHQESDPYWKLVREINLS